MIKPTKEDIGRGVVYRPEDGPHEDGVITSINATYVFVRYASQGPGLPGQATHRDDLTWISGHDRELKPNPDLPLIADPVPQRTEEIEKNEG